MSISLRPDLELICHWILRTPEARDSGAAAVRQAEWGSGLILLCGLERSAS